MEELSQNKGNFRSEKRLSDLQRTRIRVAGLVLIALLLSMMIPAIINYFVLKASLLNCEDCLQTQIGLNQSDSLAVTNPVEAVLERYVVVNFVVSATILALAAATTLILFPKFRTRLIDAGQSEARTPDKRYQALFENSPIGIFQFDKESVIVDCNEAFADSLGSSKECLIGLNMFGQLENKDFLASLSTMFQTGAGNFEGFYQSLTGTQATYLRAILKALYSSKGQITGGLGIVEDISERVKAEEELHRHRKDLARLVTERTHALKESEERFKNLFRSSPMGIYLYEVRSDGQMILIDANPASDAIIGVTHQELIGFPIEKTFPILSRKTDILDQCRAVATEGTSWQTTNLSYAEVGRITGTYDVNAFQYAPGKMAMIFSDVTHRKQAEETLQQNLRFMETLIDTIPGPVFYKDTAGRYLGCNTAFAETIPDMPKEEIIGHTVFDLNQRFSAHEAGIFHEKDIALFNNPGQQIYETSVRCSDGQTRKYVFYKATFTNAAGEVSGLVGVMLDVTDRVEMNTAIHNANATLQQRVEELSTLNRITQAVSTITDLKSTLLVVAKAMTQLFDSFSTFVMILNPAQAELEVVVDYNAPGASGYSTQLSDINGYVFALEDLPILQHIITSRQSAMAYQVQTNPLTKAVHPLAKQRSVHGIMAVPLFSRGEIIGIINVTTNHKDRKFTAGEIKLAETIAGQIAGAISSARLFQDEKRQRQIAQSLQQVAVVLTSSLDQNVVVQKIMQQLQTLVQSNGFGLFLRQGDFLVLVGGSELSKPYIGKQVSLQEEDDSVVETFHSGRMKVVDDVRYLSGFKSEGADSRIRGWMCIPLIVGKKTIGILTIDSFEVAAYQEEDAKITQVFANQAAIAIENARLFEQEHTALEQVKTLYSASLALAEITDLAKVLEVIVTELRTVVPYDSVSVQELKGDYFEIISAAGFPDLSEVLGMTFEINKNYIVKQVLVSQTYLIYDDIRENPDFEARTFEEYQIRGWMGIPIIFRDQVIGIFALDKKEAGFYTPKHAELAMSFAAQTAIAIENARLFHEIEREKRFFEALIYNSPVAIAMTNPDFNVTIWNPAAERLFGYTQAEALGKRIDNLVAVTSEIGTEAGQIDEQVMQGHPVDIVTRRTHKDGSLIDVQLLSVPVEFDGEQKAVYAIYHDLTELKRAEESLRQAKDAAEAANRAKSTFLANMSHELRTPLNAILGFTQLMQRDTTLNRDQKESLSVINHSGEHLLGLINNVLEMSKIEAGRTTLNVQQFDLFNLLDSLDEMFRLKAGERGTTLHFERDSDVPRFIRADQSKLRQVFINLLGNALKFTENGDIRLHVGLDKTSDPPLLHCAVSDTGPGVALEDQETLFDVFVQTRRGQMSPEGTGLGLPISSQFVRLMGGELSVNSREGQGATFEFDVRIEVVDAADIDTTNTERQIIGLAPGQEVYRLLIVEDRWENQQLLTRLLAPIGFEIKVANNGQEGVELWQEWQPHLIWMDVRMPVMDGYEATRRIKATPQGGNTVIIALTANALEDQRAVALKVGCDGYIRKPFHESEIFTAIENHLGVRYLYEEKVADQEAECGINGQDVIEAKLTPERFNVVSGELISELRQATTRGNFNRMHEIIVQISRYDVSLAKSLEKMVNDFAYDQILNLLKG